MTGPDAHWAAGYVGTPWVAGTAECWHFAGLVWRERFGIELGRDPMAARHAWARVDAPREGDAVLMARRPGRPCHVGIYLDPGLVLHCVEGAGGVVTPLGRLGDLGYRLHGLWRRVGP